MWLGLAKMMSICFTTCRFVSQSSVGVQMEQWLVDKSPYFCYSGGLPIQIAYQIFALCLVDPSQS